MVPEWFERDWENVPSSKELHRFLSFQSIHCESCGLRLQKRRFRKIMNGMSNVHIQRANVNGQKDQSKNG